nr:T9SS sorting signal type C domain-containing protein [uncultured Flavobacterium sp.]
MKKTFITVSVFMIFICSFGQAETDVFNNAGTVSGGNDQFVNPAKPSVLEKHRVWLNMTNTGGAFKQLLVGYIEGATNGYDSDFDGITLDRNPYIDFYSINLDKKLVIQGRALPFTDSDAVPLGYRSILSGEFTISIDHADGMLSTHAVYLEDTVTNTLHDLRQSGYTFTTDTGVFNSRFVLRYTNKTLGGDDFETVNNVVSIVMKNASITINSTMENLDKIFVYDMLGRQLSNQNNIRDTNLVIHNLPSTQQILLVKVFLENGKHIIKKTIFK